MNKNIYNQWKRRDININKYISCKSLIESLNRFAPEKYDALINQLIINEPAADVEPVVRCKDCVHGHRVTTTDGDPVEVCCNEFAFSCGTLGVAHSPNFFCAEGENK